MSVKFAVKNSVLVVGLVLLSGCGLLSPFKAESVTTYELNTLPPAVLYKTSHPMTIFVAAPETNAVYNTNQIAYSTQPYQIAFFANNHWAETPPKMLQPLMVQALQNTGHFHAVIVPPIVANYDFALNTQLVELRQDFTHTPGTVTFTLRAQLINAVSNHVVASQEFSVTKAVEQNTPLGGVVAANQAVAEVLGQLAEFSVQV